MPSNGEKEETPDEPAAKAASAPASSDPVTQKDATQLTCDVLCSLSGCSPPESGEPCPEELCEKKGKKSSRGCSKQHQLPMFLSSKFVVVSLVFCMSDWMELPRTMLFRL